MLLAVALHKTPGREDEAYKILKHAIENGDGGAGPYTFLWAKSAIARMLRRVKRDEEAKELEEEVMYVAYLSHRVGRFGLRVCAETGSSGIRMVCRLRSCARSSATTRNPTTRRM